MTPDDLRRPAKVFDETANAAVDPQTKAHFRMLATEYRAKADAVEGTGVPIIGDKTQAPGIELPSPTTEEPND